MKRIIPIRQQNRWRWALRTQVRWHCARYALTIYSVVSALLLLATTLLLLAANLLDAGIPFIPAAVWLFDILAVRHLGGGE